MNMKRIICLLLSLLMMASTLTVFATVIYAEETTTVASKRPEYDSEKYDSFSDYMEEAYISTVYDTPEEKLATMEVMMEQDGYQLYVDDQSGEVCLYNTVTGETLFSNPYDVASSVGSDSTKQQILSQIAIQYTDNGTTKYLYSFTEAACRGQITVMKIKKGIRVEYSIGREESRKLVPQQILKESFEEKIVAPLKEAVEAGEIKEFYYNKILAYFNLEDPNGESKRVQNSIWTSYPITEEQHLDEDGNLVYNAVYVWDASNTTSDLNFVEGYIKQYCEDYTFEEMDKDHEEAGYEEEQVQYPLFKLALEYSIDDGNLIVTMPCNGLRYDMTAYTLEYISILPYMGAGNSTNAGYNFYPDGSGSLFDYETLNTKSTTTIRGKIYGVDYAYHEISGATYQKVIRYPVYGSYSNETIYEYTYTIPSTGVTTTKSVSNTVKTVEEIQAEVEKLGGVITEDNFDNPTTYSRAYLAIVEEGESLGEISTYHAGALSDYNTMMTYFNPKPKDSYDLADSISVTSSSTMTVVSERKYTDNITIRYIMMGDDELNEGKTETHYECSWLGMAEAYRDYLVANGSLTKIQDSEVSEDYIPLYLEVFGAMETQQTIATLPVDIMTPLTTFENILTMYEELSEAGAKNVNFKMTGYANGGLYYTVPSKLKWERAVGGSSGFEELIEEAQKINAKNDGSQLGLYPDFDFAYIQVNELFDSVVLKRDAIKTIDDRYTSLRVYSATQQAYVSYYQLALSPCRYSHFYEKLLGNYADYEIDTLSVASLGYALNSDFDEDEPYNREDNKEYTIESLEAIQNGAGTGKTYKLMSENCNAYAIGYMSHLLSVSLESSRYVKSSASVPFVGAVLHGYVQFTGTPFNEEGDTSYAFLRAIENGASLYFILSYQNTSYLKEDDYLSQYYSVRYDIWKEDVVDYYNELNDLLKDVQTKVIVNHEFLVGERILDLDELEEDIATELAEAIEAEEAKQEAEATAEALETAAAWVNAMNAESYINDLISQIEEKNMELETLYGTFTSALTELTKDNAGTGTYAYKAADTVLNGEGTTGDAIYKAALVDARNALQDVYSKYLEIKALHDKIEERVNGMSDYIEIIENSEKLDADIKKEMTDKMKEYKTKVDKIDIDSAFNDKIDYIDESKDSSIWAKLNEVLVAQLGITDFLTADKAENLTWDASKITDDYGTIDVKSDENYGKLKEALVDGLFSMKEIIANLTVTGKESTETEEKEDDDLYVVDNNNIVAVTYGDRNDTTFEKTEYKTFLLNYNTYAVRVTYEDRTYTIESGAYVVVKN